MLNIPPFIDAPPPTTFEEAMKEAQEKGIFRLSSPMILSRKDWEEVAALLKNNRLTTLEIHKCKMDLEDANILAEGLKENTSVRSLALNRIEWGKNNGIESLITALNENTSLISFRLSQNELSASEDLALATLLRENKTLQSLSLQGTNLDWYGTQTIRALGDNSTLISLNLSETYFDSQAPALADSLDGNTTLRNLDLTFNFRMGDNNLARIIRGLQNTGLSLYFGNIGFQMENSEAISAIIESLNQNKIIELCLGGCLKSKVFTSLINALKDNTTLTSLYLGTQFEPDNAVELIIEALQKNITLTTLTGSLGWMINPVDFSNNLLIKTLLMENLKLKQRTALQQSITFPENIFHEISDFSDFESKERREYRIQKEEKTEQEKWQRGQRELSPAARIVSLIEYTLIMITSASIGFSRTLPDESKQQIMGEIDATIGVILKDARNENKNFQFEFNPKLGPDVITGTDADMIRKAIDEFEASFRQNPHAPMDWISEVANKFRRNWIRIAYEYNKNPVDQIITLIDRLNNTIHRRQGLFTQNEQNAILLDIDESINDVRENNKIAHHFFQPEDVTRIQDTITKLGDQFPETHPAHTTIQDIIKHLKEKIPPIIRESAQYAVSPKLTPSFDSSRTSRADETEEVKMHMEFEGTEQEDMRVEQLTKEQLKAKIASQFNVPSNAANDLDTLLLNHGFLVPGSSSSSSDRTLSTNVIRDRISSMLNREINELPDNLVGGDLLTAFINRINTDHCWNTISFLRVTPIENRTPSLAEQLEERTVKMAVKQYIRNLIQNLGTDEAIRRPSASR